MGMMFDDKFFLTSAVLERRKTKTRRFEKKCQEATRYHVGDRIAVKRSYFQLMADVHYKWKQRGLTPSEANALQEQYCSKKGSPGWNNKMFVSDDLMMDHIVITDVEVQHLQDITEDDCIKEGVLNDDSGRFFIYGLNKRGIPMSFDTAKDAYAALIDKMSGKGTWDSNPFVVAYTFELEDKKKAVS